MSNLSPYLDYKDSGIDWFGQVPSHWSVVRSDQFIEVVTTQLDQSRLSGQEVFHYSIPVVQKTGTGQVEDGTNIDSSKFLIDSEVILVSKLNPRKGTICIACPQGQLTVCSTEFVPLSVRNGVNVRFLNYLVQSENNRQRLDALVTSATRSHQRVNPSDVRKFWLAIPPLSEQEVIASFLDRETAEVDAFIADQDELIELLRERRSATITQTVTKGLDHNVATKEATMGWQHRVNEAWSVVQLKVAGNVTLGKMLQPEQKLVTDELRTYMRAANVQPNHLVLSDQQQMWFSKREASYLDLRAGDVVVVEGGAGFGRSACLTEDLYGWAFQNSINRVRPRTSSEGRYLNYVLKSVYASGYLDIVCNKATIPHLTAEKLEALRVPLPTKKEQTEISDYLDFETAEIDAAIADATEAIELSKERRSALISAAVTGKIDVRDHITAELRAA